MREEHRFSLAVLQNNDDDTSVSAVHSLSIEYTRDNVAIWGTGISHGCNNPREVGKY